MKRLLAVVIALAISVLPAAALDWSRVFDNVRGSVVQLFHGEGSCSAFSINQEQYYYLTAHHCLPPDLEAAAKASEKGMDRPSPTGMYLFADAVPGVRTQGNIIIVKVIKSDAGLDLALIQAEVGLPALQRGREARIGEEIAALGYGLGEPSLWQIPGHVIYIKDGRGGAGQRAMLFRFTTEVGGMSGGPVVNTRGDVVSMVQQGVMYRRQIVPINYGTSIKQIREFARNYWR